MQQTQQEQQQQFQDDPSFHIPPIEEWGQDSFLMSCCQADNPRPLRVAVLVSGGVDSSLALQLVAAAGHTPTAFYLQIWFQEDFRNFWDACPWEEDLSYAQQVCQSLGVPLVTVPLTQQYWDRVVSHSVAEIKAGRTPNPDMLCNSRVKFGAFVEYLEREHAGSFDCIASGHYAMVKQQPAAAAAHAPVERSGSSNDGDTCSSSSSSSGGVLLCCCPDPVKDQTYFLANLSPLQLSRWVGDLAGVKQTM
jgi:tRNA-specific 2-thiouridylase